MENDLAAAIAKVSQASTPEDLFGVLAGDQHQQRAAVKKQYRDLARRIHPDCVPPEQAEAAAEAFTHLEKLRTEADKAIEGATYGDPAARVVPTPVVVKSRRKTYIIGQALAGDGIASLYECRYDGDQPAVLKVARQPSDNDLLEAEAAVLRHLRTPDHPQAAGFFPYLPEVIETFRFQEEGTGPVRVANVFVQNPGFYSLAEVQAAHPDGVSAKHMAWMWRQLLQALGYAHARGVIHGAVLPSHVHVHPDHDLVLSGWCCAVRDSISTGLHIPAMDVNYEGWYPPEVPAKQSPLPAADILMSARCMIAVMGGDPIAGKPPVIAGGQPVPPQLRGFLQSCLLAPVRQRPQDAWQLRDEFTRLIEQLWGPRRRIPFTMPSR